jgi:hypothetical protein
MGIGKSNKNRLRVRRVVDVPLSEVSGICSRRSRNGRMFLLAVGDRVTKIAWFSPPRSQGPDRLAPASSPSSSAEFAALSQAQATSELPHGVRDSGRAVKRNDIAAAGLESKAGGRELLVLFDPRRACAVQPRSKVGIGNIAVNDFCFG